MATLLAGIYEDSVNKLDASCNDKLMVHNCLRTLGTQTPTWKFWVSASFLQLTLRHAQTMAEESLLAMLESNLLLKFNLLYVFGRGNLLCNELYGLQAELSRTFSHGTFRYKNGAMTG